MESFIPIITVFIVLLYTFAFFRWFYTNTEPNDKTERKLESDKTRASELAVAISEQSARIEKDKELSERIRECESGIENCIREQTKIVEEARKRSRTTVELADECLNILEEAEETSEQS